VSASQNASEVSLATALYLDVPLLTHNHRHYANVPGLHVVTEPDP
jgi:hypothetical protein